MRYVRVNDELRNIAPDDLEGVEELSSILGLVVQLSPSPMAATRAVSDVPGLNLSESQAMAMAAAFFVSKNPVEMSIVVVAM